MYDQDRFRDELLPTLGLQVFWGLIAFITLVSGSFRAYFLTLYVRGSLLEFFL